MLCWGQNGGLMWGKVVKSGSDINVVLVWGDYPPSKARNTFSFFSSIVITIPPILHHCYNKTPQPDTIVITKPPLYYNKSWYCYIYDHGTDGTKIKKTCEECYDGAGG